MQGNDHDTRMKAAQVLGEIGPSVLPKLLPLLKHADDEVRQYTVVAIGNMGLAAKETIPQLIEMLSDVEDEVRSSTADALAEMGPAAAPAIDPLLALFKDPDDWTRERAAEALGAIGPEARPKLLAILRDPRQSPTFQYVCLALGSLRPLDKATVTEVSRLLQHQDENLRIRAALALSEMESAAVDAVPQLLALYKRDPKARWVVGVCFGRMGTVAPEAVKILQEALRDPDATLRIFAVVAFSRLDMPPETLLGELRRMTKDENVLVRRRVVDELQSMNERARPALPEIQALLNDPDQEVRSTATYVVKCLTQKVEDDRE